MELILIVFIVIGISFIAVIAAVILMMRNNRKWKNEEEVSIRAEILRTDISGKGVDLIPSDKPLDQSGYFVTVRTDQNKKILLTCKKKLFFTLLSGFYGDFVYKGTRIISFHRLIEHEERRLAQRLEEGYFFQNMGNKSNPCQFYCDGPELGIDIPEDDPIDCDVNEVIKYANRMFENTSENFFGLDNGKMVVQFFNDGKNDKVYLDIPVGGKDGSYQAVINGVNQMKTIIRSYYHGDDIFKLVSFSYVE